MYLKLTTTILVAAAAALTSALTVEKRIPIIAGFTLATTPTCPISPARPGQVVNRISVPYGQACGQACGQCNSLSIPASPPIPYTVISDTYTDPRCIVTLFQTFDCSDDGVVTGTGCWTPDGGIKGYKVSCPWWPEASDGGLRPCSGS